MRPMTQDEQNALQIMISEGVPGVMVTTPYDYELRDRRMAKMSEDYVTEMDERIEREHGDETDTDPTLHIPGHDE